MHFVDIHTFTQLKVSIVKLFNSGAAADHTTGAKTITVLGWILGGPDRARTVSLWAVVGWSDLLFLSFFLLPDPGLSPCLRLKWHHVLRIVLYI